MNQNEQIYEAWSGVGGQGPSRILRREHFCFHATLPEATASWPHMDINFPARLKCVTVAGVKSWWYLSNNKHRASLWVGSLHLRKNTILVVKEWNWNMKKRSKKEDKVPLPLAHGGIAVLDPIKLRLLSPTKAKVVQLWWAMGQRFLAKHHQTWNSKNWILKIVLSLWFPMYSWIWPLLSARGGKSVLLRSPKRSTCPGSWSPICQWPGAGEQFAKPWASEITVDFLIWFSSEKIQSEGLTREKWWHVSRCQGSISGTSRSWALLPHMGRSTNSFSKLDVKIKPTQKKHTIPNWNIPKSSQIWFIIIS